MKTIITSALCILLFVSQAVASSDAYQKAMEKHLKTLGEAQNKDQLLDAANGFERVANNEKKEWLPLYYTAFAYISMSRFESGLPAKDATLAKARTFLDKALGAAPGQSEVVLLDGFAH